MRIVKRELFIRLLLVVTVLSFFTFLNIYATPPGWSADIRITNDPASSTTPALAVNTSCTDKNIYIVWQDNRTGQSHIWYAKLDNNGTILTGPKNLTPNACRATDPAIDISLNGNIHIVWVNYVDCSMPAILYGKFDGNGTLLKSVNLTPNYSVKRATPDIDVDMDGKAHIVWEDWQDGRSEAYYNLIGSDGNKILPDNLRLTNNVLPQSTPKIAVDYSYHYPANSVIHVVYGGAGIGYIRCGMDYEDENVPRCGTTEGSRNILSMSDSVSVLPKIPPCSSGFGNINPDIMVDYSGNAHIVSQAYSQGFCNSTSQICYAIVDQDGTVLDARPVSNVRSAGSPAIADLPTDSGVEGIPIVVWHDTNNGGIYYSRLSYAISYGPIDDTRLTSGSQPASGVTGCLIHSSKIHLVWSNTGDPGPHAEIYYKNGDGTGLVTPDPAIFSEDIIHTVGPIAASTTPETTPWCVPGETKADIYATIHNMGVVEVSSVKISFYEGHPSGDYLIESVNIGPILAGGQATAQIKDWTVPGSRNIYVQVDPHNEIQPETTERNNIAHTTLDCGKMPIEDWPMFRRDPWHQAHSDSTAPATNEIYWIYHTDGTIKSSPAIADGMVFIGASDGVYAFDEGDYNKNGQFGERIWKNPDIKPVNSSPAVYDGKVFISAFPTLYALDEADGHEIWSYPIASGRQEVSSPVVAYDRVFVATTNDLWAFTKDGTFKWKYHMTSTNLPSGPFWIRSTPAVAYGKVFVGSIDGRLYAVNADTGNLVWQSFITGNRIFSSPSYAIGQCPNTQGGEVLVGTTNGFYALAANDVQGTGYGQRLWHIDIGTITSSPAVNPNQSAVSITAYNNKLHSFNLLNGYENWPPVSSGGDVLSSPAVADDKIFFGSTNGKIYAFDESGNTLWTYLTGGEVVSSPAIADGKVFVGSSDGNIYAFGKSLIPDTPAVFRVTKTGNVFADKAYYGQDFLTGGADIAEQIEVSEPVEPGDVVALDPDNPGQYRKSRKSYSTLASGVISTQPGFTLGSDKSQWDNQTVNLSPLLNQQVVPKDMSLDHLSNPTVNYTETCLELDLTLETITQQRVSHGQKNLSNLTLAGFEESLSQEYIEHTFAEKPLLALMGVVPVKATTENGPIKPGDLLVSSSTPGHVMRCVDKEKCAGAIIGKALEPLEEETGIIRMLVMR